MPSCYPSGQLKVPSTHTYTSNHGKIASSSSAAAATHVQSPSSISACSSSRFHTSVESRMVALGQKQQSPAPLPPNLPFARTRCLDLGTALTQDQQPLTNSATLSAQPEAKQAVTSERKALSLG